MRSFLLLILLLALFPSPLLSQTIAKRPNILLAIQWEERDLMNAHPEYHDYRKQVPMIIPFSFGRRIEDQRCGCPRDELGSRA